jgi:hypothetical protein
MMFAIIGVSLVVVFGPLLAVFLYDREALR